MGQISGRSLGGGSRADGIRAMSGGVPTSRLPRALAQPAGVEDGVSVAIARELAYGTETDRAALREMVQKLSPRAQANLMLSIASAHRDPTSPASAIRLTPEGQSLMDVVFNGAEPSPEVLATRRAAGDPTMSNESVVSASTVPADGDLSPLPAPQAPRVQGPDGKQVPRHRDAPKFRSEEQVVQGKDGTVSVKHKDVSLDRQTATAIKRAKAGEPVGPIYDDPTNTPPGRPPGGALAAGTQTPRQSVTNLVKRLSQLRDPHLDAPGEISYADLENIGIFGDVPHSVFAPQGQRNIQGARVAAVNPQDHGDAMRAFDQVRRGGNVTPNQQYSNAEEFARDLVARGDQEAFNVTPVTPRQRAEATEMLDSYHADAEDGVPRGQMTPGAAGQLVARDMPDAVRATKAAQRAVTQEQTIQALARKFDEIFGKDGWGENYKPSARPATDLQPPTVTGPRPGTTQDPAQVPSVDGRDNLLGEPAPVVRRPIDTGKPGMELGEDLTDEDLLDLDAQRMGEGEGPELPGGEAESQVTTGRRQGDKLGVKPSKPRKEGGNLPGEYEDAQSFDEFNRRNPMTSDSDIARRQRFYEEWKRVMPDMDPARSSVVRKELDALMADEGPMTDERAAKIDALQRQLRGADQLDRQSGVRSLKGKRGKADAPADNPADVQNHQLIPASRPLHADEIEPHPMDLNNEPIDVEFEIKPDRVPDDPTVRPADDPSTKGADPEQKPRTWADRAKQAGKTAGKVGAGIVGGGLLYDYLRRAGQPPGGGGVPPTGYDQPYGPGGGGEGGGIGGGPDFFPPPPADGQTPPGSPADRIRAMRSGYQMQLNPHTQVLQSWTY